MVRFTTIISLYVIAIHSKYKDYMQEKK